MPTNSFGRVLARTSFGESHEYGQEVYYIHADHLGTPRAVVDGSGAKRWEWSFRGNPFGEMSPNEDPENSGESFELNLRFPGQYYDAESGLHYNYFRDYEPQTGRYVQSDPIGLDGGLGLYLYAHANPLVFRDSFGLAPEMDPFRHLPSNPFPALNLYCRVVGGCDDERFNKALREVGSCALDCTINVLGTKVADVPQDYLISKVSREASKGLGAIGNAVLLAKFYVCLDSCAAGECE
jgi:RHS repeat-associated protein